MKHTRFETLEMLIAMSLLVASCGGETKDLGSDGATGGSWMGIGGSSMGNGGSSMGNGGTDATDSTATGTGGSLGNGGMASTGGSPTETGGSTGTGGSTSTDSTPTGTGGSSTGTGGSSTGTGGMALTGGSSAVPYVLDPTLPIDPTCTCDSNDKICNAARECVPRCDDAGHCVQWLAERPVIDMLVEGSTLYYLVDQRSDIPGSPPGPSDDAELYRVETTGGTPTRISWSNPDPRKFLGRYEDVTYIFAYNHTGNCVWSTGETGAHIVAWVGSDAAMRGHWIVYTSPDDATLMGIDLTGDLKPVVLAQLGDSGSPAFSPPIVVLDDAVVYRTAGNVCSLQLSNLAKTPDCAAGEFHYAASSGTQYYASIRDQVVSFAPPATRLLKICGDTDGLGFRPYKLSYANSWVYVDMMNSSSRSRIVRAPTNVGRLPQQILPEELFTRHSNFGTGFSEAMIFAVGPKDFFWVQALQTQQAQYIFSAPLPPQPCDAELPCADTSLVCTNGFCGPA